MRRGALILAIGLGFGGSLRADEAADRDFFEAKIRPVLVEHCYRCHSEESKAKGKLKADLLLDTKAGLLRGGTNGPSIVRGKPGDSLLLKAMRHDGDVQMPPSGKLPATILDDFARWIERGAHDPRDGKPAGPVEIDWTKAKSFWSFQPPIRRERPPVKNGAWPKTEIDWFLLAELEKRGLEPVGVAGKAEWLRRATFDLIGLPPTPEEIDAFAKDETPDAYAKVVDRLLASPHYGERWGRYWLDVARYAEDKALAFANARPHAYRYRDWVVQALNRDMPYDRFLRLQIAGDQIADPETDRFVKLAGLGFQGLGHEYHRGSVAAQVIADELDDRIDTLSRGLLGLTVSCARCHDHKYDPVPTRDYYSLAAAYNGSNLAVVPLADPKAVAAHAAWAKQTKEAEAQLTQWVRDKAKALREATAADAGRYLLAAWRIRTLKRHKTEVDVAAYASREKLHASILDRTLKAIEQDKLAKIDPALAAWTAVADKAAAAPKDGAVDVPLELQQATDALAGMLRPEAKTKSNLLKSLTADPQALFFVDEKQAISHFDETSRKEHDELQTKLAALRKTEPPAPPLAHAIEGGGTAMKINLRGNVERQGELAPPGFLRILTTREGETSKFTRRELAEAVADPKNPLTARVIVNRVWHYHFGRGIVGTTSNFGQLGDRPSHPELLDALAVRFMDAGWSLRWLHREIMLSAAYRLSSKSEPRQAEKDPDNVYLWRFAPRRLDFEAWRDSWLAVSGKLDRTVGGPSLDLNDANHVRRTLYSKISRLEANKLLILFDFPDANVTSDRRSVTTVPQQQLFVLNSDFTLGAAKAFAQRLEKEAERDADRIQRAFRLAYGRAPSEAEREASAAFLRDARASAAPGGVGAWEQFAQAILAANEFMWVD